MVLRGRRSTPGAGWPDCDDPPETAAGAGDVFFYSSAQGGAKVRESTPVGRGREHARPKVGWPAARPGAGGRRCLPCILTECSGVTPSRSRAGEPPCNRLMLALAYDVEAARAQESGARRALTIRGIWSADAAGVGGDGRNIGSSRWRLYLDPTGVLLERDLCIGPRSAGRAGLLGPVGVVPEPVQPLFRGRGRRWCGAS